MDFFVGQLESLPQHFDVHHHARELIANPKSKFNSLHRAIISLAGLGSTFRVVTTNYDDHLASAAAEALVAIPDTWHSPALPLGRDFAGLVHLHGSVLRPKEEMILTDRDFGHAYITDAWAARFLLSMFARFTVVFVGYSHDDVIMRYLALGLPSEGEHEATQRFAFTNDPSDAKWKYLGIQPIAYPAVGRNHGALVAALDAWGERARMKQTEHRALMQAIVTGGTKLPLPDRDYLQVRLSTEEGALDFANAISTLPDDAKLDWLLWLEDLPEFKALFNLQDVTEAPSVLGHWFARTFIQSPDLNGAALQTLQRLGQSMAGSLYQSATWVMDELEREDATAGGRWRVVLSSSIQGHSSPLTSDLLTPLLSEGAAPSTAVLRTALRPQLRLERRWYLGESDNRAVPPDASIAWNSDEHGLSQQIRLSVEAAPAGDRSLGGALQEALTSAYDLLEAYRGERRWDPLTFSRSAIEPHAQDGMREPLDAIVDGLRDYGLKALLVRPALPDEWWEVGRALMRRLALHLVASDPVRSDDEKLEWVLARTGLYADNLKHEIYQVLKAAVPNATPSCKARVLTVVEAGPGYPEDLPDHGRHHTSARLNLLAWLTQVAPDWSEAQTALDSVQAQNPDLSAGEHPDFDTWMSSGTRGGTPPMPIDDFIRGLDEDLSGALDALLSQDYSERIFEQPDWSDALELVALATQRRPDLGMDLWDVVASRGDLAAQQGDLHRSIVNGWAEAELAALGTGPADRVRSMVDDRDSAHAIGQFLLKQIRQGIDFEESSSIVALRILARALWEAQGATYTHSDDLTPLSFAPLYMNSWPGFLAQFWGAEVDRRWRHHRDDWAGLSDEESEALVALLSGNRHSLDATQPAVAGELFFFFSADEDFAITHLLPIFRDDERHAFGWYPFLFHVRWNDHLLQAGLLDCILAEMERLEAIHDARLQQNFLGLVASIVSYAGISSANRRRLLDQIVLASDGAHAVAFAETVVRFIRSDGVDGAEVWRSWLGKHAERRLTGQPRVATPEELARWADAVPAVGRFTSAAATLFSGHNIGLSERSFHPDLPQNALDTHGTALLAFLAERVSNTSARGHTTSYRIARLVDAIRAAAGEEAARPLIDAARDGGFIADSL
ncbi:MULTISPECIES: SIR2 family protein [unclassified Plantibacter]|uniref:SIR2 family protein n=1 Tax=unclassified Plantibacter TaxID=2624265 RepID=UPI0013DDA81A|nr:MULTISPECIES: SIR2 family protein [unclassified Plantibacter]